MSFSLKTRKLISNILLPDSLKFSEQFAFGHREVLIAALGLDSQIVLRGGLQHGWVDFADFNFNRIQKGIFGEYPRFVWNKDRFSKKLTSKEERKYIAIGSPWAHLVNFVETNMKRNVSKEKGNTLLYFPKKSQFGWEPQLDLNRILEYKKEFNIQVCLYWLDYTDYRLTSWLKKNEIEFFCAGYRGSSAYDYPWMNHGGRTSFLLSLYTELERSELVVVDDVGSAFWYALSLGKPVRVFDRRHMASIVGGSIAPSKSAEFIQDNEELLNLTGVNYGFDGSFMNLKQEHVERAKSELGWHHINSAKYMILKSRNSYYVERHLPKSLVTEVLEKMQSIRTQVSLS